jgi:demethylmenaquinone methyltransferase/2-methoxy-6-polyprenyl-1,4-benzoquinol methylase
MIAVGRKRQGGAGIAWCQADALKLPFPDSMFDAVTSGFLARNVPDMTLMFKEQVRVVKPGGKVVCLDTSPVPDNIFKPLVLIYYRMIIPIIGFIISGERDAYRYLPETTIKFVRPDDLVVILKEAGLTDVKYRRFMFGNIAVHWGVRPV